MKAIWNGRVLAESDDIVTVEGNAYFPAAALDRALWWRATHTSAAPGRAPRVTISVQVDGKSNPNAVWYYARAEAGGVGNPWPGRLLEGRAGRAVAEAVTLFGPGRTGEMPTRAGPGVGGGLG